MVKKRTPWNQFGKVARLGVGGKIFYPSSLEDVPKTLLSPTTERSRMVQDSLVTSSHEYPPLRLPDSDLKKVDEEENRGTEGPGRSPDPAPPEARRAPDASPASWSRAEGAPGRDARPGRRWTPAFRHRNKCVSRRAPPIGTFLLSDRPDTPSGPFRRKRTILRHLFIYALTFLRNFKGGS